MVKCKQILPYELVQILKLNRSGGVRDGTILS